MPSNVLIVPSNQTGALNLPDFSSLAFDSILHESTITGHGEDSKYPFANTLDYRDNTLYSPSQASGSTTINFAQSSAKSIDYVAFAVHNSQDSGLSGLFQIDSGAGYVTVAEFSGVENNRPFMATFDAVSSTRQRLVITYTSKVFIGAIQIGKSIKLKCPSMGFQTGRFAPLDIVEGFNTEGSNFVIGRRKKRGFQMKADLKLLDMIDLKVWYKSFQEHTLESKTMFYKWSSRNDEVMYGRQNYKSLTKPTYITPFNTEISLEINGYA